MKPFLGDSFSSDPCLRPCSLPQEIDATEQEAMDRMDDLWNALMATGAAPGAALGCVADAFGTDRAIPLWGRHFVTCPNLRSALPMLDDMASVSPRAACRFLQEALRSPKAEPWRHYDITGIHLHDRPWITELPTGITFKGMLDCAMTGLTSLPPDTVRSDYYRLKGCKHLTAMLVAKVEGTLDLRDCTALECLSDDLDVRDSLWLQGCTSLADLPRKLRVGHALKLESMPVRTLPDHLSVGRNLMIHGCPNLVSLPTGLTVRAWLHIRDCPNWDGHLPEDIQVGGGIITDQHVDGISLSDWRKLNLP